MISNPTKPEFLGYIHSFRGLAILLIVLGHATVAAFIGFTGAFDDSYPLIMVSEIFYHDSTLYFAIISGLLFSKVLRPKGYHRFYTSKLKNILLPYIFFTLLLTLIRMKFSNVSNFQDGFELYFTKVFRNFIFGKANFALWYIPVLIFLYLVTPLLDYLQKTNKITKVLFVIIMLAPLYVSRIQMAFDYILKLETMIYFVGAYAVGMYLGADLDAKLQLVKKYKVYIVAMALVTTAVLFYLYIQQIDMIGKVSLKESVYYIQKICFALILIMLLKRLGTHQPKWIKPIARDSFSIYFMHGYLLFASYHLFAFVTGIKSIEPFNIILGTIMLLVYAIGISMLVVFVFKKVFCKYSRMIVGA